MKPRSLFLLSFILLNAIPRLASAQPAPAQPAPAPTPATDRDILQEGVDPWKKPAPATSAPEAKAAPRADKEKDAAEQGWEKRASQMREASTLNGGVGLVHTQHASGGAWGQFRVGFTTEFFSAGFLCSREYPCPSTTTGGTPITSDSTDHIGGRLSLAMQVLPWLEAYLGTSAYANSNNSNRPALLQVLGDSVLGGKAHAQLTDVFSVGGAFELWLLNGSGSVGLDGGSTSAKFRGLGTADLRGLEKKLPLRFSLNTTYSLDNSGAVLTSTESARGTPVTRIERFGLNVNRVDHFDIAIGAELFAAQEKIRPFIEYEMLVPVNRQGYQCHPNNPSSDHCLANDGVVPSTLTIGSRFYPWEGQGLQLTAALDIGISGTGNFIEEMRPTAPWMLYIGAGWAFDVVSRPPRVLHDQVPITAAGSRIHGFVHEEGSTAGINAAIAAWDNHPELTSLATGTDGRFTTHELPAGPYTFAVRAEGYKPGTCTTDLGPLAATPASPQPAASSRGEVQLDCSLVALPRVGSIVGKVKDLDTGSFIGGATIKVVDAQKKELSGSSDPSGAFRFELVSPGESAITVDVDGYLVASEKLEIKAQKESLVEISVKKKPKNPLVAVQQREIIIRQQVQFAVDSATILGASTGLLTEIADTLLKNPRIRRLEVQGHTDGTGSPAHNMTLSEERATSVVAWLSAHGVASDRLTARGYGDSKPLVPNVTDLNRQRNRRVQFIITEQDPATPKDAPAAKPAVPAIPKELDVPRR